MAKNEPPPNIGRWLRLVLQHKIAMPALYVYKRLYSWFRDTDSAGNLMVNVGGGYFLRRGWKSLDYHSPSYPYHARYLDFDFDLTSGEPFPFADNSVRYFYSQHTLEHIPQEFCPHIFSEFHRCLKPGGVVRLTMPDFDKPYGAYMAGDDAFFSYYRGYGAGASENALIAMFATARLGRMTEEEVREKAHSMPKEAFADYCTGLVSTEEKKKDFGSHINWWTHDKLERMLQDAGFLDIHPSRPYASRFRELQARGTILGLGTAVHIERMQGFDSAIPERSVYVEAVK